MARRDRHGEELDGIPISKSSQSEMPLHDCEDCINPDPQVRALHHLMLAREGLTSLREHLRRYYAQHATPEQRWEAQRSLTAWIGGLMSLWNGLADEHTGRSLAWWEARQLFMEKQDVMAQQHAQQAPTRQPSPPHEVQGFTQMSPRMTDAAMPGRATQGNKLLQPSLAEDQDDCWHEEEFTEEML